MTIHSRVATFVRITAVVTVFLAPAAGYAQANASAATANPGDGRWQSWLGCWSPLERAPRDRDIQVCITPGADARSVRLTTFAGDQRILEDSILADGSTQTMHEDGCRGSTRSQWATNAARLFRVSELECEGKPSQRTSEIAALQSPDEWLDVQVIITGKNDNVRTRHDVRSTLLPPPAVRDQVSGLPTRPVAVNAGISVDDVIEANAMVSSRAVEAWLSESEAGIPVHKPTLRALHDAHVPANVIDLMIARAYPEHFEIHKSGGGGSVGSFFDDMEWSSPFDLMFDPYAFYYSPFGSYRRFVDPSFYALGGYVIVPAPTGGTAQDAGNARVVNGAGYTRVEPRQPPVIVGPRQPSSSGDSYGSGSSSSSSGSTSSSSSGGGTTASTAGYSSGGGGAQTAVPR
ncbi:MAG TPA: hypothetical protein VF456_21955 [Vicinamibacterales bacterium]